MFAADFTRLLVSILPTELQDRDLEALRDVVSDRTSLEARDVDVLLELALSPENRATVSFTELRAFGSRFGSAEEKALRRALAEEIDLAAFSERYGTGEALLLLDALFSVCALDGMIDKAEIGRLQRAASELGIDPVLVSALFRKHDVRHAAGDFTFELERDEYVIGRGASSDIQLPDPQVALRHAKLIRKPDGNWSIIDLNSGRPTLIDGQPTTLGTFRPGQQLRVGPYTLSMDRSQRSLTAFGMDAFSALSVRDLSRTINGVALLDKVSFTVFSGEVIALVGPSGAGKTTLLNAIAGIAPADSGDVLLDGQNFHTMLANDRSMVGIVPQEDVVHGELTVEESLRYAGRLRFPSDVGDPAVQTEVDRVLQELGIEHIRDSRIGSALKRGVSGGQRKRVNLGQELLTRTTKVLFLDEPTSGLDPQTAQEIVSLVRQLADDGRIVFLVTHDVSPSILAMVDHLLVLARGGRVAWFGPAEQSLDWFNTNSVDGIFARLPDQSPEEWGEQYREGRWYRKLVRTREHLLGLDGVETGQTQTKQTTRRSFWRQYSTLTSRYFRVKRRDVWGTGILLAQAPVLAVAMMVAFQHPDKSLLFMLTLSTLWFGASGSVREFIVERHIWRREARVGLQLLPYILSKLTVLGGMLALQSTILTTLVFGWFSMGTPEYGFSLLELTGVLTLVGFVGTAMGLLMSALFSSSEAAVGTLPLVLIPQIAFGGLIVDMRDGMSELAKVIANLMITRYGFEWSIKTGEALSKPGRRGIGEKTEHIKTHLYDLGFRGTGADDLGHSPLFLAGVLFTFLIVFLVTATFFTGRSRRGN